MTNPNTAPDLDAAAVEKAAEEAAKKVGDTGKAKATKAAATPKVKAPKPERIELINHGEYAITNLNIERITDHLKKFNETPTANGARQSVWVWPLVDVLGIKRDGTTGKRFHEVLEKLEDNDPLQLALKEQMQEVEAEVTEEKK